MSLADFARKPPLLKFGAPRRVNLFNDGVHAKIEKPAKLPPTTRKLTRIRCLKKNILHEQIRIERRNQDAEARIAEWRRELEELEK